MRFIILIYASLLMLACTVIYVTGSENEIQANKDQHVELSNTDKSPLNLPEN